MSFLTHLGDQLFMVISVKLSHYIVSKSTLFTGSGMQLLALPKVRLTVAENALSPGSILQFVSCLDNSYSYSPEMTSYYDSDDHYDTHC